jgi:hypothetical protein
VESIPVVVGLRNDGLFVERPGCQLEAEVEGMTHTPDEIKMLMANHKSYTYSLDDLMRDALALIQKLQAENAEKSEKIRVLESRNNALYYTILGVMHFVDKWLDVPAYDPDEDLNGTTAVGRASHAREIALQAIEQLEAERDTLVAGVISVGGICSLCKHGQKFADQEPCNKCRALRDVMDCFFEWRGVQKD